MARSGVNGSRARGLSEAEIVRVTLRIVKRSGVEGLTMRELADKLGVTVGAAYKYVSGKDELLGLVVAELISRVEAADRESDDPIDRVRALLVHVYDEFAAHPGLAAYLAAVSEADSPAEHLMATMAEALAQAGVAADLVEEAMRVLFFYVSGSLILPPAGESRAQTTKHFGRGLDIILSGLAAEAPKKSTSLRRRQRRTS